MTKVHRKVRIILLWAFCLWLQSIMYYLAWPMIQDFYCYLFTTNINCTTTIHICNKCTGVFSYLFAFSVGLPLLYTILYGLGIFFWSYLGVYVLIDNYLNNRRNFIHGLVASQALLILIMFLLIMIGPHSALKGSFPFFTHQSGINLVEAIELFEDLLVGNLLFMLFFVPFRHRYLMPSKDDDMDEFINDEEE